MIWPSVFYHLSVSTADQECVSLGGRISAPRHRVRAFLSHLIKDRGQVNDIKATPIVRALFNLRFVIT